MAYTPRSSLIPAEASGAIPVQMKRRRTVHAFGLIATIIFILSLFGAVGVFLYKDHLLGELETAKQGLSLVDNQETRKQIAEIRHYDGKINAAKQLLESHVSPSRVFEEIENSTKETVQLTAFEFLYDPGFETVLSLSGNTREFASVALQKMQILEDGVFSEFVLQDITTSESKTTATGQTTPAGVTFKVTGVFSHDLIAYTGAGAETQEPVSAPTESPAPAEAPEEETVPEISDEVSIPPIVIPPPAP